ncbi:MAG TPA: nucleotidyltransferase family protein [Methylomirabilota bacterium]|nr:nucleotidyltransferase family protein [Methylomirabilota bacterium]
MTCAAVVLAAGLSRRMGQSKLLLQIGGRAVIRLTVERILSGGVDTVLMVTGAEHEALTAALAGLPVRVVVNPHPESGQSSSIRVGIEALSPEADAALIVLGDQPFLDDRIIPTLVAERRRTGKAIVAPRYRDGRGNPVLFARELFPELLDISGDQGARAVLERDPDRVALVDFDFPMPADLDTPEDYARLRSGRETR